MKLDTFKGEYKKTGIISLFLIPVILLLLLAAGSFLFRSSYDILVSKVGGKMESPHPDVMLILIDENSITVGEKIFNLGRWPWNREIYAAILDYIHLTSRPKAVFFDILFSEASRTKTMDKTQSSDSAFQAKVIETGNVYHNIIFSYDNERKDYMPLPEDIKKYYSLNIRDSGKFKFKKVRMNDFTIPITCLRIAVECGYEEALMDADPIAKGVSVASFVPDSDGVHRRGRILFDYHGNYFPSVSLAAIMEYQRDEEGNLPEVSAEGPYTIKAGKYLIPVNKKGEYLINYYPDRIIHHSYSMGALLESAGKVSRGDDSGLMIDPDAFNNKIIIIGCSAVGCQDLKTTPVDAHMPGPEIHATLISNILQGNGIIEAPYILKILLVLLSVYVPLLSILYSQRLPVKIGIPVLTMILFAVLSFILFHYENFLISFFSYIGIGFISTGIAFGYQSIIEGREKRKYSKILGNLVDPHIVKEALHDLESLKKGAETNITPFFSDIAGFTTISEKLPPIELSALLNEYLSEMTHILKQNQGTLDKYIGDAIVGIFGAPLPVVDHPLRAAEASLEMLDKMEELRNKWTKDNSYCEEAHNMRFRIGLNTGKAKVGFMGTNELASYTMMGDTVNLAARLEAAGKDYGVAVMISEFTYEAIKDHMFTRILDQVRVKGKTEGVKFYELISKKGMQDEAVEEAAMLYETGFESYLNRDWKKAIDYFEKSLKARKEDDKSSRMIIERCHYYEKNPPPENWDGIFTRLRK